MVNYKTLAIYKKYIIYISILIYIYKNYILYKNMKFIAILAAGTIVEIRSILENAFTYTKKHKTIVIQRILPQPSIPSYEKFLPTLLVNSNFFILVF